MSDLFFGDLDPDGAPVTEYGVLMSGGGYHVEADDPEIEDIYPMALRIEHKLRNGGCVYRRRVIVVEDWTEITEAPAPEGGAAVSTGIPGCDRSPLGDGPDEHPAARNDLH